MLIDSSIIQSNHVIRAINLMARRICTKYTKKYTKLEQDIFDFRINLLENQAARLFLFLPIENRSFLYTANYRKLCM